MIGGSFMTRLGVQLYSVREQMQVDPGGVLDRLAEIGYRAVEPTLGLLGGDPAGFRELLDARGLTACALHGPALGPLLDDTAAAARAIGSSAPGKPETAGAAVTASPASSPQRHSTFRCGSSQPPSRKAPSKASRLRQPPGVVRCRTGRSSGTVG
jgi:hypothetical protein